MTWRVIPLEAAIKRLVHCSHEVVSINTDVGFGV